MEIPISNGINLLWGIINYQPSSYWGTLVYGNPHFEWDKSAVGHYQLSTFKLLVYPRVGHYMALSIINLQAIGVPSFMEIPISNGINLLWGIINYQPSSYWGTLVYGNPHFEWDKSAVGHYQLSTFKLLGYPRLWKSPFRMG